MDDEVAASISAHDYRAALAVCAREHGLAVGRLCMALLGSQAEAQDLLQETLLAAYDSFDEWRREGSLRAWLCGIARRQCARHLERKLRRERRLRLVHDANETELSEELALLRQRAEHARLALEQIRPSEREALVLRYAGELSFRDVALACGIDEAAARKRVSRGLARLREALKEEA
jgi:RNA polymerase sigma-70 factor (ECF subfamily)